jgi:protein ImuA
LVQNKNKTGSNYVMSKLDALRSQVRALEGYGLETRKERLVLPFTDERLNSPLPQGGLSIGALHEFHSGGLEAELSPAVTAFAATVAAHILRRRAGFVLWASSRADCYPPGLIRFGLDPARIAWVGCRKDTEVLSVMEEALHSRALAAVLGETSTLSLRTGRRLDAAARQSATPALLLRRHFSKPSKAAGLPSGAAATRWCVTAVSSQAAGLGAYRHSRESGNSFLNVGQALNRVPVSGGMTTGEPGLRPPRWQLDLEYCRNGRTASWIVEALDGGDGESYEAGHVRVVAELRDDAGAPETASTREASRTARAS